MKIELNYCNNVRQKGKCLYRHFVKILIKYLTLTSKIIKIEHETSKLVQEKKIEFRKIATLIDTEKNLIKVNKGS